MAEQDFTPAVAAAQYQQAAKHLDGGANSVLCADQLQVIKSVISCRVMAAVAAIADPISERAAIITTYRRLGADLLAKFSVPDVVDIPSRKFAAACEFLDTAAVITVRNVGAQA